MITPPVLHQLTDQVLTANQIIMIIINSWV